MVTGSYVNSFRFFYARSRVKAFLYLYFLFTVNCILCICFKCLIYWAVVLVFCLLVFSEITDAKKYKKID
ncbi:hypothetical protein SAMN05444362_101377 [Dysgonomonas macrotermitis]|uniref:Uncharacterized protein n=1 Tax=Dysgonomonas macrotermitis TaxID=1346286 RepID=A0A1M4TNM0_9BACT|nr:hypothetical protein SAMN05444362_101377 [Dysgonomonas macrotermitis]